MDKSSRIKSPTPSAPSCKLSGIGAHSEKQSSQRTGQNSWTSPPRRAAACNPCSIQGGVTGLGADYIIIDDPVEIKDCDNTKWLTHVNELFDNEIITRLDNPKKGGVAVLAHRLHEDDLPGHLLSQSGWTLLKLPLIAPRARTYHLGNGEIWERQKGELLMPEAFTSRDIEQRRAAKRPGFETLQQQNPTAKTSVRIQATDFASFSSDMPTFDAAIVLSVDPGQKAGANHSFCVIQAWAAHEDPITWSISGVRGPSIWTPNLRFANS